MQKNKKFTANKSKAIKGNSVINGAIATIVILLILGAVFYSGLYTGRNSIIPSGEDSFEAGWKAAEEKLRVSGNFPDEDEVINSLRGNVIKIEGNKIHFTTRQVVRNPLSQGAPTERIAIVGGSTKIIAQFRKSRQVMENERENYRKRLDTITEETDLEPPTPYINKEIGISELKEGDRISIESKQNIKLLKEFTASEVLVSVNALLVEDGPPIEEIEEPEIEPETEE